MKFVHAPSVHASRAPAERAIRQWPWRDGPSDRLDTRRLNGYSVTEHCSGSEDIVGLVERREREKAELREQILKAARAIVLKEGFEALSMRKIAQAIEYSPATIYLHFPSREEIARQLTREAISELLEYFAPLASIKDAQERLWSFGKAYVEFGLAKPESYRLCFMTNQDLSSEIFPKKSGRLDANEPGDRALLMVADTVRELIRDGLVAPIDPELAAHILWSSIHGIVSLHLNCPNMSDIDVDQLTDAALGLLKSGLEAGSATGPPATNTTRAARRSTTARR